MPRPRRTAVASSTARVVTSSSEEPPTTNKSKSSKASKADSMAPLKKTRVGATKFKKTQTETEEIESSGQVQKKPAKKAPARKPAKKVKKKSSLLDKLVDEDEDEDELEEPGTSALDMLKARMGHDISSASRRTSAESASTSRKKTSSPATARPTSRVASTPRPRQSSVQRGRTPPAQKNTSDDLYGLSPAGKASQAKLAPRRSSVPRAPLSALKVHGTPSMEISVLALQNFKRRPRQPSLIRMVQQSSEIGREDADALLGAESELDDTLGDFDQFMPQDESTPLNFGKKRKSDATEDEVEQHSSSSRKRQRHEVEEDHEDDIQIPGSPSAAPSPPHIAGTTWARRRSRSESLPEDRIVVIASTEEQAIYAEPMSQSDTQAPPRSSSEPVSPRRQRVRGAPSPSETGLAARGRQKNKKKTAQKISTEQLQSMLPMPKDKMRKKDKEVAEMYDIESDSEEEVNDNDELSRPARRKPTTAKTNKFKPLAAKSINRKNVLKTSTTAKGKQKRTYGRQASIEKENDESVFARELGQDEDEDEDTVEILPKAKKSKELEKARKKFAKVDEWEMEFESVDLGGGESSPWR